MLTFNHQEMFEEIIVIEKSAYDTLKVERDQLKVMKTKVQELIEVYDWCYDDPIDRGYSLLDDTINEIRNTLGLG
jgi:hypothetical protein